MEPSGRNEWQPVANRTVPKTAAARSGAPRAPDHGRQCATVDESGAGAGENDEKNRSQPLATGGKRRPTPSPSARHHRSTPVRISSPRSARELVSDSPWLPVQSDRLNGA